MRIESLLHSFETDPAASGPGTGEAAPAAPAEPAEPAAEAASAEVAAPAWSPDDPAFQSAVREAAAEVIQERSTQTAPTVNTPAAPVDWNEYLDPMSPEYGQNLVNVLKERDQYLVDQIRQMQAPVLESHEAQQQAANETALDETITGKWDTTADGDLSADHLAVIKTIARAEYTALEKKYGDAEIAGEKAIQTAVARVKAIAGGARTAGAASNAAALAALAGASGEPGTNGSGVIVPLPAKSPMDLHNKWFNLVPNGNTAA